MKIFTLFALLVLTIWQTHGQDYQINFTGSGLSSTVDAVWVINITSGDSLLVDGQDTLLLSPNTSIHQINKGNHVIIIYPNPLNSMSKIEFQTDISGEVQLEIIDIKGKSLIRNRQFLQAGRHVFEVSGLRSGVYLVKVNSNGNFASARLVSANGMAAALSLRYSGTIEGEGNQFVMKSTQNQVQMVYLDGERLLFKGMSGDHARIISMIPTQDETIDFEFIECMDKDGNHYSVVTIGNQTWMAENLAYLPSVSPSTEGSENFPYYYVNGYQGVDVNEAKATDNYINYGVLYNWTAAKSSCPQGWHLPGDGEWSQLIKFLDPDANPYNMWEPESYIAGGFLKSTRTQPDLHPRWDTPNSGALNTVGFSSLPGGFKTASELFVHLGLGGYWWTLTDTLGNRAWSRRWYSYSTDISRDNVSKSYGLSARCLFGDDSQIVEPEGTGTETDPYLIENLGNLNWVSLETNNGNSFTGKFFLQIDDIDASQTSTWSDSTGWIPIGNENNVFSGSYNGQNHTIESLYINRPEEEFIGLFGILSASHITNVKLINASITGYLAVGGLAGMIEDGSTLSYIIVENISLNLVRRHGGGVVGYASNSNISRCSSSGEIFRGTFEDWNNIGGLIGFIATNTVVNECFSLVNLTSQMHNTYGGLIGTVYTESSVYNSYARGSVVGTNAMAGGLIGELYTIAYSGQVENCFSTGMVSAPENYVGGFVGRFEQSNFSNNFWDIQTSNQTTSPCATGLTTDQMKLQSTFIDADWDFEQVWDIDGVTNDGYPFLRWQLQSLERP